MSTDDSIPNPCLFCNNMGAMARVDWRTFKHDAPCPDCGAVTQVAPEDSTKAHVNAVLAALREVLLLLPGEERDGQLGMLRTKTARLDPRCRPGPNATGAECPSCGKRGRKHIHQSNLRVCDDCEAVWGTRKDGSSDPSPVVYNNRSGK